VIVLDTHAWVWWLTKTEKLGRKAKRAIDRAERIGLPAICAWEVAAKAQACKLRFDRPYPLWIDEALVEDSRLEVIPLLPAIAVASVQLSWDHRDPADRFIVASARVLEAPLITSDDAIRTSQLVPCIWD
jgi:PIN domain nuclease of toxin-antitoxin system